MIKNFFTTLGLLLLSLNLCAQTISHSTYLVGRSLKNAEEVKQIDYKQFNYIYLMAAPKWNHEDFNAPQEEIINRLVTNHHYATDSTGTELIPLLIKEAYKHGTKVLISFSGDGFRKKADHPQKRKNLVRMMVAFAEKYNYDGIEIDWEKELSIEVHIAFMADIREQLDIIGRKNNKHYILTTALQSWQIYTPETAGRLSSCVDWINIMTYDLGGGIWGKYATHNTPFDKIKKELKNWDVFDRQKLCIGLANYGFIYKGIQPDVPVKTNLSEYGAYISYNNALSLFSKGWTKEYDQKASVYYYFSPDRNEFITIENEQTIKNKIEWIAREKYRGAFWWEFSYDIIKPSDKHSTVKHHLIDVAGEYLRKNNLQQPVL